MGANCKYQEARTRATARATTEAGRRGDRSMRDYEASLENPSPSERLFKEQRNNFNRDQDDNDDLKQLIFLFVGLCNEKTRNLSHVF